MALGFEGTRLQGSYLNLRHFSRRCTTPHLTQRYCSSSKRVPLRQYSQHFGIFLRKSTASTSQANLLALYNSLLYFSTTFFDFSENNPQPGGSDGTEYTENRGDVAMQINGVNDAA